MVSFCIKDKAIDSGDITISLHKVFNYFYTALTLEINHLTLETSRLIPLVLYKYLGLQTLTQIHKPHYLHLSPPHQALGGQDWLNITKSEERPPSLS